MRHLYSICKLYAPLRMLVFLRLPLYLHILPLYTTNACLLDALNQGHIYDVCKPRICEMP